MRKRTIQLHVMLTGDEAARAEAVAEHYGLDTSSLVRMLLKREFDTCGQGRTGGPLGPEEKAKQDQDELPARVVEQEGDGWEP